MTTGEIMAFIIIYLLFANTWIRIWELKKSIKELENYIKGLAEDDI